MFAKLRKNLVIFLALTSLIYFSFIILNDYNSLLKAFSKFNLFLLPIIVLLVITNYLLRFLKWQYYLNVLGIKIATLISLKIFLSGFVMAASPAKAGELIKSYYLKEKYSVSYECSSPIIIAERITDFLSLLILAVLGALIFNFGREIVFGFSLFLLTIIVVISNKNIFFLILKPLYKIKKLKNIVKIIENTYKSITLLISVKNLTSMTLISVVSWFFECLALYVIILDFGYDFSLLYSTFIYSFSTIAGALSFIPGGLGVTEGSLTYLLANYNVNMSDSILITFIIRFFTLWFAVLLGIIFTFQMNKLLKSNSEVI